MARIAVVGAGVSGLATAYRLAEKGADVTVVEASGRAGGVINSIRKSDFLIETAANGFVDKEPAMKRLVRALGLESRLRPADEHSKIRYVYTRGKVRTVPSKPPAFLATDLVPFSTKMRVALEPFTRRGPASQGGEESLASFASRHIGKQATSALIDAVQTGIFAGDHEKLSVGAVFPKMVEMERDHRSLVLAAIAMGRAKKKNGVDPNAPKMSGILTSFDNGMQTLTDALAEKLDGRVRLNTPVRALSRNGDGWRLALEGGALDVDKVVLASPAHVTAKLLSGVSDEVVKELQAIEFAKVASVHLGYYALPNPPEGFGFLIPSAEQRRILGALFISSFFPWRAPDKAALLTVMVGGARHPELVDKSEDELAQIARAELDALLGIKSAPDFVQVVRWQHGAIPQYNVGHLERVARIDAALAGVPGLFLTGNSYKGIGVNDCVRNSEQVAAAAVG